eukprot:Gb_22795 [translate_table: standard]
MALKLAFVLALCLSVLFFFVSSATAGDMKKGGEAKAHILGGPGGAGGAGGPGQCDAFGGCCPQHCVGCCNQDLPVYIKSDVVPSGGAMYRPDAGTPGGSGAPGTGNGGGGGGGGGGAGGQCIHGCCPQRCRTCCSS